MPSNPTNKPTPINSPSSPSTPPPPPPPAPDETADTGDKAAGTGTSTTPSPSTDTTSGTSGTSGESQSGPMGMDALATQNAQVIAQAISMANEQRRKAPAATPDMDKTVPGGMYIVGGQVVNARGEVVKDAPKEVVAAAKTARLNRTDVQFEEEED